MIQLRLQLHFEVVVRLLDGELQLWRGGGLVHVGYLFHLRTKHLELLVVNGEVIEVEMIVSDVGLLKDLKNVEHYLRKQLDQDQELVRKLYVSRKAHVCDVILSADSQKLDVRH